MKSHIQHYLLSTSEHEWRSNIGYILFPTLIITPRYAGTLFAYHGNPVKIFKRIFFFFFLPILSSHDNNDIRQMIQKTPKRVPRYARTLCLSTLKYQHILYLLPYMGDIWEILTTSNKLFAIFQSLAT